LAPGTSAEANAQVAQLVEHVTENHGVAGSIPALGTIQIKRLGRSRLLVFQFLSASFANLFYFGLVLCLRPGFAHFDHSDNGLLGALNRRRCPKICPSALSAARPRRSAS
jgi:hypothetical protein